MIQFCFWFPWSHWPCSLGKQYRTRLNIWLTVEPTLFKWLDVLFLYNIKGCTSIFKKSTTAALQQRGIKLYTWRYVASGYQDTESAAQTRWPSLVPTQAWGGHLFLFPPVKADRTKNITATWLSENRDPGTPNCLYAMTTNPAWRVHTGKGLRRQWTDTRESGKMLCRKELPQFHFSKSLSFSLLLFTYVVLIYSRRTSFPNRIYSDIPPSPKPSLQRAAAGERVAEGAVSKLEVILPTGGCLCLGCVSTQGTLMQSNKPVPGGSTGLVETREQAECHVGFQGNLISSTWAQQKARARK